MTKKLKVVTSGKMFHWLSFPRLEILQMAVWLYVNKDRVKKSWKALKNHLLDLWDRQECLWRGFHRQKNVIALFCDRKITFAPASGLQCTMVLAIENKERKICKSKWLDFTHFPANYYFFGLYCCETANI